MVWSPGLWSARDFWFEVLDSDGHRSLWVLCLTIVTGCYGPLVWGHRPGNGTGLLSALYETKPLDVLSYGGRDNSGSIQGGVEEH